MAKILTLPPPKHHSALEETASSPLDISFLDQMIQNLENIKQVASVVRDTLPSLAALSRTLGSLAPHGATNGGSVVAPPVKMAEEEEEEEAPPRRHRAPKEEKSHEEGGKKRKKTERNYNNPISLVQAVWQVLDRKENSNGLKVSEICDIIEKEKLWETSNPKNFPQMVTAAVYKLKGDKKVVRGDQRRYYIPEGAEPPEGRKKKVAAE